MKNPRKIQNIEFSIGLRAVQGHCGTFRGGSDGKESACNAEDLSSIPGSGTSPGERNGYPLQYFAWKIPWTEEPGGLQSMGLQSRTQLNS